MLVIDDVGLDLGDKSSLTTICCWCSCKFSEEKGFPGCLLGAEKVVGQWVNYHSSNCCQHRYQKSSCNVPFIPFEALFKYFRR